MSTGRILIKARRGQLGFLWVTTFLNFVGLGLIVPIMPFTVGRYVAGQGAIALYAGLLFSVYALCSFLAAPGFGALSDRFGRRPVLLVSMLGSVIGYVVFAIGGSIAILFAGRIVDGLTAGNVTTIYSCAADITEPRDRARTYGLLGAAIGLGFVVGPAIGGLASGLSLAAPVWLAAIVFALNLAWGYFVLPESLPREDRANGIRPAQLHPFGQLAAVFSIKPLRRLLVTAFLFLTAFAGLEGILSVYVKDTFGWSVGQVALLLVVLGFFSVLTQGGLARALLRRFDAERVAPAGLVLAGIGVALAAATAAIGGGAAAVILLSVGLILFIVGHGLFEPSNTGLLSNTVERQMQGRVQGAYQAIASMTRILGPLLAGALYSVAKILPFASEAVLAGVALVTFVLWGNATGWTVLATAGRGQGLEHEEG
jgi:DHA1 family tetracycline resistance protein-like MFS transporter